MTRVNDRGFSLVEVIATVAVMGIAFAVFVGGMGTTIVGSDKHRQQAVVQAGIRNFAEAVKAVPFNTDCTNVAATYLNAYSAPVAQINANNVATNATSHVAPSLVAPDTRSTLVTFFGLSTGTTLTPPVGTTELWDSSSMGASQLARVTSEAADMALTQSGASGDRAAISVVAADSVARSLLLQAPSPGPVRRGATTASNAGAATLTLTKPTATVAGDVMIAHVVVRGADAVIGPPTGWTQIATASSGANVRSAIFQRVATTTSPNSYAWNLSPNREAAGGIVAYGGVQQGYTASVPTVRWWNGTAFTTTCPSAASQAMQLVTLRLVSNDNKTVQSIDIVKRCTVKPTPTTACGDT